MCIINNDLRFIGNSLLILHSRYRKSPKDAKVMWSNSQTNVMSSVWHLHLKLAHKVFLDFWCLLNTCCIPGTWLCGEWQNKWALVQHMACPPWGYLIIPKRMLCFSRAYPSVSWEGLPGQATSSHPGHRAWWTPLVTEVLIGHMVCGPCCRSSGPWYLVLMRKWKCCCSQR